MYNYVKEGFMKRIIVALSLVLFAAVCITPSMAKDITLTCNDCKKQFVFTEEDQAFNKQKGIKTQPTRCAKCLKERKIQSVRGDEGRGAGSGGNRGGGNR